MFWRLTAGHEEPALVATSEEEHSSPSMEIDPPVQSLLHWAVQQRMPASNYDTDQALFFAAPVGADDRFHGALGLYVADRRSVARDRVKSLLAREGVGLGILLDLFEDARITGRYRARAERLASAAERVQSNQDLESLGQAVCETALEVSGGTRAGFVVWNEQTVDGQLASVSRGHPVSQGLRVLEESLVGTACRERLRFIIREAYRRSDFPLFGAGEPPRPIGSVGIVPLLRNHHVLGAIVVEGDEHAQLTAAEGELLSLLATVAAVALENVTHLAQVHERTMRDGLTGLRNRRGFDEHLHRYLRESDRHGQPVSLVLVDIDFFKKVNDTHGHDAGDAVLIAVAKAIENSVRDVDLCARFGGEELAILLPQTHLGRACDVAERLRRAVAGLIVRAAGAEIAVTASFGVASYPETVRTHDAFFTAADRALYQAKRSGRNCVKVDGARHVIPDG
jgi:diguanylate cyclase (GGDEF)-like protein